MDFRETLRCSWESVSENPRRVLASAMGVFWGAAAIVLLLSWGTGFHQWWMVELGRYGRGMVFLFPAVTSSGFPGVRKGVPVRLTREDAFAAERANTDLVEALLPEHQSRGRVLVEAAGGRVRRLDLSASDERFAHYRNFAIEHGRFFDQREVEAGAAVAVIGPEAAAELFGSAGEAIGTSVRVEGRPFRVIGVPKTKGRQYFNTNRPDNRLLMIPITAAEDRLGYDPKAVGRLVLFPRSGVDSEQAIRAVFATLGPRAGFHPDDDDAVKWFDSSSILAVIDLFHVGFAVFIGVAGTLTLLIGGVGIANYHLATLAERTVEIGVAKAIGARNRVLVTQTVIESLLVSASTAGMGTLFGIASCGALAALTDSSALPTPVVSTLAVGVTFGAVLGVAVIAAVIPALRVRNMEISAALRAR